MVPSLTSVLFQKEEKSLFILTFKLAFEECLIDLFIWIASVGTQGSSDHV